MMTAKMRKSLIAVFVLALLVAATLLAVPKPDATLILGPFLQQPTADGIRIGVEFDEPTTVTVVFGVGESLDQELTTAGRATRHELLLTELAPDTDYTYEIRVGEEIVSGPWSFRTAPEGASPLSFLVFGDSRSRSDVHAQVVDAMRAEPDIGFYVQTGDLVSDGGVLDQWYDYFAIEQPMMARTPIYPVIGNHDEDEGDATNYVDVFMNPDHAPEAPELYYSFDYGNVHGVVLDSHVHSMEWFECLPTRDLMIDGCFDEGQERWLQADLGAAAVDPEIDHIVLFIHIGPYSSKENRSGNHQMRELLDWFHAMGVTAIISGHDHYYERGAAHNGIPYVITGGGGAPLYEVGEPSEAPHEVAYNESVEHYRRVDVDGVLMTVSARGIDGRIIDEFEIDTTPECEADTDCEAGDFAPDCAIWSASCSVGSRCVAVCEEEPTDDPDAGSDASPSDAGPGQESDVDEGDDDASETDAASEPDAGSDEPDAPSSDRAANDDAPTPDTVASDRGSAPEETPGETSEEGAPAGGGDRGGNRGLCALASTPRMPTPSLWIVLGVGLGLVRPRRRFSAR